MRDWAGRRPLVGRGLELEHFAAALADRGCRGFVVGRAAGVGKSRWAEECLEPAADLLAAEAANAAAAASRAAGHPRVPPRPTGGPPRPGPAARAPERPC